MACCNTRTHFSHSTPGLQLAHRDERDCNDFPAASSQLGKSCLSSANKNLETPSDSFQETSSNTVSTFSLLFFPPSWVLLPGSQVWWPEA